MDLQNNMSCFNNKENINTNVNTTTSKSLATHGKSKKSLSRIKSNYFYQNLGTEIRTCTSNSNLRKQQSRKRRNGNSSTNLKNKNKGNNQNYYTHRDKEVSKRGVNSKKILTDITENRYKKIDNANSFSK